MSEKLSFFAELKRRNVIRAAGLYLVGAWLIVQVAGTVLPMFGAPEWLPRSIVILLVIGFVPAVIFSWVFELTPQGLKRDEDVPPEQSIAPQTGRRMDRIIIAVLVLALAYFCFDKFVWAPRRERGLIASTSAPNDNKTAPNAKSIAVLPFENLSEEKANAYFAEGVQDEILTRLSNVRDLKVISRTSTAKYQSKPDNLKTVANELGVATLLEGAVQKLGDKVRVNVQLIDARTDSHLWAKSYDRDLKDVFAVQSEVAQQITDKLRATLSQSESHALTSVPTQDPQAYDLFLKGEYELRAAESVPGAEAYARAEGFYRQAITRDPKFAQAYAALAYCSMSSHWFFSRRTAEQLAEVKSLIDRALELAPDSPDAHFSLATFRYWGHREYDAALAELDRTLELQPNNAKARQTRGWIFRRQGKWEQYLSEAKLAQQLDPRDGNIPGNIALGYCALRQWNDAEQYASRALAIDPHLFVAANAQVTAQINGRGDIEGARQTLENYYSREQPAFGGVAGTAVSGTVGTIAGGNRVYVHVLSRRFNDALASWDTLPPLKAAPPSVRLPARTVIQLLAADFAHAKSEAEQARPLIEKGSAERPDDLFARSELAWIYVALGRKADALRVAQEAADQLTIEMDAILGPAGQLGLAEIEAWADKPEEAAKILRRLLSIPSPMSIARLKIDPVWDPIRNHPDFQKLLTGPELIGPNK
jgi:TolB-like protein